MPKLVNVDRIAEVFNISSRQVQRLHLYDGLPREARGKYDLDKCTDFYISYLHDRVCGCAGGKPGGGGCDVESYGPKSRDVASRRVEREAALREIVELAPKLAGKKAAEIREVLTEAIDVVYGEEK
jgi:phage terminase Nu1 subunit (DNA packaging protein)